MNLHSPPVLGNFNRGTAEIVNTISLLLQFCSCLLLPAPRLLNLLLVKTVCAVNAVVMYAFPHLVTEVCCLYICVLVVVCPKMVSLPVSHNELNMCNLRHQMPLVFISTIYLELVQINHVEFWAKLFCVSSEPGVEMPVSWLLCILL